MWPSYKIRLRTAIWTCGCYVGKWILTSKDWGIQVKACDLIGQRQGVSTVPAKTCSCSCNQKSCFVYILGQTCDLVVKMRVFDQHSIRLISRNVWPNSCDDSRGFNRQKQHGIGRTGQCEDQQWWAIARYSEIPGLLAILVDIGWILLDMICLLWNLVLPKSEAICIVDWCRLPLPGKMF